MRRLPALSALRAFEAAARLGSFNRAAEELHVTATAISHQIRGLEAYCGQTLFRRWPRPIALTDAGMFLFPVLREGLDRFSTAIEQVRTEPTVARRLKISTTNAFAARCMVPMLPAWRAEHPDIELVVIGTDAVVDLRAGEADVALRYARATPRDGVSEELTRDRFHVVAAPSLLAKSSQEIWQRLPRISYDWLPHDKQAPTWERWKEAARDTTKAPGRVISHFREELHAIEAVIAGQGVAICSDMLVKDELASGALVRLSKTTLKGYGLHLVTLPERSKDRPVQAFCAWIRKAYEANSVARSPRRQSLVKATQAQG